MSDAEELLSGLDTLLHCPFVLHQIGNGVFSGPIVYASALADPIDHSVALYLILGWKQTLDKCRRTWVLAENGTHQHFVSVPLTDTNVLRLNGGQWLILIDDAREFAEVLTPEEHFEPVEEERFDIPA